MMKFLLSQAKSKILEATQNVFANARVFGCRPINAFLFAGELIIFFTLLSSFVSANEWDRFYLSDLIVNILKMEIIQVLAVVLPASVELEIP